MKFDVFERNVMGWADARGIYKYGTEDGQWFKAVEELGELAAGIARNRPLDILDAIGDVAVCLVNANALNSAPDNFTFFTDEDVTDGLSIQVALACCMAALASDEYLASLNWLRRLSTKLNVDFDKALEQAWNEIKDRKGQMNEHGVFVKEEAVAV